MSHLCFLPLAIEMEGVFMVARSGSFATACRLISIPVLCMNSDLKGLLTRSLRPYFTMAWRLIYIPVLCKNLDLKGLLTCFLKPYLRRRGFCYTSIAAWSSFYVLGFFLLLSFFFRLSELLRERSNFDDSISIHPGNE